MPLRRPAALILAAGLMAVALLWLSGMFEAGLAAAVSLQRALHGPLAAAARGLAAGEPGAVLSLCGLAFLYGLIHAAGPGHGKALLGAVAATGQEGPGGLAGLAALAALGQAVVAIVLVYGGLWLLSLSPMAALRGEPVWAAPMASAAAGAFGLLFVWRGLRMLASAAPRPACHHSHGLPERAGLVAAVAVRPCGGAMLVLAVAWMAGAPVAGIGAALAMAAGTALVTAAVALGSRALREATLAAGGAVWTDRLSGALYLLAGAMLSVLALGGLRPL